MKTRILLLVAVLSAWPLAAQSPAPGIDAIRKDDLRADLFFYASDAMNGRLTDTRENRIASEFLKSRFERMGLSAATPDYFQGYDLMTATLGDGNVLTISHGADTIPGGTGWYAQRFSATTHAKAPVVFCGYGITAPDLNYDDYRDAAAIRGKIVLVVDGEPGARDPNSPFDGVVTSELSASIHKAQAAEAKGAAGILFVSRQAGGGNFEASIRNFWPAQPPRLERYTLGAWMNGIHIPAAQVSPDLAARLVTAAGKTLADLEQGLDTTAGMTSVPLPGVDVDLTTAVNRHVVPDRNVLAKIEGSDPRLKDEWIVISGHIDHDGGTGTQIFNGADDNGSGAIGVLEIAQAYVAAAKAGKHPRRSILFAEFNSEERGLLGSWAYTEQPIAPLDKTIAALNMDMVGRNEEVPPNGGQRFAGLEPQTAESNANALNVIGTVRAPDLKADIDRDNKSIALDIHYRYDNNTSQLMRRSDHWPFIQHGVPGLWFFTGLHPDYHMPGDRPEKINYDKMERILKLIYQVSWDLANADGRPRLLPRK